MRRVFTARVVSVAEHKTRTNYRRVGPGASDWEHDEISLGWFVLLDGSHEAVWWDANEPTDVAVGDLVRVTMERVA